MVGIPGLEPGITGPESVVLPITPYPNDLATAMENHSFRICGCKGRAFFVLCKSFSDFFCLFRDFLSIQGNFMKIIAYFCADFKKKGTKHPNLSQILSVEK